MKICIKCTSEKSDKDFYIRYNGKLDNVCKECHRKYRREHYLKYIDAYKKKANKSRKIIHKRNTDYLWEYLLAHPCADCGEKDPIVLEFDHIKDKFLAVTHLVSGNLNKMIEEIKKCEVVCCNCHKRRTAKRGNFWKTKKK